MTTALAENELALVRNTALLGGLSNNLLSSVLRAANVQQARAGELLFMQDDRVDACFVLLDGWVKLYRLNQHGDEAVVNVFCRGESFAEAAVFSMAKYPATAEAVTDARLLRISCVNLQQNVRDDPQFAFSMLASTSRHLQGLVRQIEQLKTYTGVQRVARFLASLCPVEQGSCTISLPYDKTLIAGRLGMKPESLSRAFVRLRSIGVRVEQSTAAITSVERLRSYASENRSESKNVELIMNDRLNQVLDAIDCANAMDPNVIQDGVSMRPAELVYGERMSGALEQFYETASDHLRIAVRAQHIERWVSSRDSYPTGRAGYLKWRSDLKTYHARRASELMNAAGYNHADTDRVAILIAKKDIKHDLEVQMLEDVACLVFLQHYAGDFIAKHHDEKVADILRKTTRKMSTDGITAAKKLLLPERLAKLLIKTLAETS